MKSYFLKTGQRYLLFILFSCINLITLAQDSTVSSHKTVTTTTSTQGFVIEPWMYIVGGIIILAVIIGLASGSKKEVVRTTVVKDNRA